MARKKTAVFLAEGFEEIEAVVVIDFLRRANIEVISLGVNGTHVTSAHGITLIADESIDKMPSDLDGIILPGGMPGATNLAESANVRSAIEKHHQRQSMIAAICASPVVVLAPTGILKGRRATCFPGFENAFSDTEFKEDQVVRDGHIITSRGPGTADEFALEIIRYLIGKTQAESIRAQTLTRP
jgi:4-methyl-5(b-hydroxyethyl)-thiazole monophosphate biosynthesis